jgi:hypothetical protein
MKFFINEKERANEKIINAGVSDMDAHKYSAA